MKNYLPFLIALIFISCDKDDPTPPTTAQLLTSASWKFDSGGVDQDKNGTIDFPIGASLIPACVIDNTVTFSANGTGVGDEGATKCDPAADQTTNFTWTLTNNNNQLNITGANLLGLGGSFKLTEISDVRLGLSKDTVLVPSTPSVTVIVYLKH